MPGFGIIVADNCGANIGDGPSNNIETARKHRFVIEVCSPLGSKKDGIILHASKCDRPAVEIDEITIHHGQDEIFRPGKQHWRPVEISFYEKLYGSSILYNQTAQMVRKWWGETMINLKSSLHNEPSVYLKNTQIDMLDGDNVPVWSYVLYDSWPSKVTPDNLDYSDSNISQISLTLRYAKAQEFKYARV